MTDRSIGTIIGLKSKSKAPGPMSELSTAQERRTEAIIHAIEATDKLERERDLAANRVHQLEKEYAALKTDTAQELMTQKIEYEGHIANARADNAALRRQLNETGEKLEKYERWCFQIQTKCEDLQKYFGDQLRVIEDAKDHVALGVAAAINNAATSISTAMTAVADTAQHATDGLGKQVTHIISDSRAFLADLQQKAVDTPYRPEPKPEPPRRPLASVEELSAQAEAELTAWMGKRKTMSEEEAAG